MKKPVSLVIVALGAVAAIAPSASAATITFGQPLTAASTSEYFNVFPVDLDRDGNLDLIGLPGSFNGTGATTDVLLGKGDGSFLLPSTIPGVGQIEQAAAADFNKDGATDVTLTGVGGAAILLGNGRGGLAMTSTVGTGYLTDIVAGDVTGDGKLDLVATSFEGSDLGRIVVFAGADNGTFTPITSSAPFTFGPRALALANLDGDGKPDLVVAAESSMNNGTVLVLKNTGSATQPFNAATPIPAGNSPRDVKLADMNHDGKLDAVVSNKASADVSILLGDGTGGFTKLSDFPVGGTNAGLLGVADFDGDGNLDVAVGNTGATTGQIAIFAGKADGSLGAATQLPTGDATAQPGLAIGDFNNDDRPDLAYGIGGTPKGAFVRLDTTLFPPPTVVTGGSSDLTQTTATVSGTIDTDGRRGSFHFEVGPTTAYGTSTNEVNAAGGFDPQAVTASLTGLTAGTTFHYRLVGRTRAGGIVNGADQTFTTAGAPFNALQLTKASFNVKFTVSRSSGQIILKGTSAVAVTATIKLQRDTGGGKLKLVKAYTNVRIPQGAYNVKLKAPATLLPGAHVVQVTGKAGTQDLAPVTGSLKLAAPKVGIARTAFVSAVPNGPAATRLPGRRTRAFSNFVFNVQPARGSKITIAWFAPGGQRVGAPVTKPNAKRVGGVISSSSGLPKGRWRSELRVRGVLVAVVSVRIG